jgi:hypothetical protein
MFACEKDSSRSGPETSREVRLRAPNSRHADNKRYRMERSALLHEMESLKDLRGQELREHLEDEAVLRWLSEVMAYDILQLIREAGIEDESDVFSIVRAFAIAKSKTDPQAIADWLSENPLFLSSNIGFLAAYEPEMAADAVARSQSDKDRKHNLYPALIERAATTDAERAARLAVSMQLEQPIKELVLHALMAGADGEEITPTRMKLIFSTIPKEQLDNSPLAVRAAGRRLVHFPIEQVLAEFPLGGTPTERLAAIRFLEEKAYRGVTGDVEIREFLQSEQAAPLSETERDVLKEILGD